MLKILFGKENIRNGFTLIEMIAVIGIMIAGMIFGLYLFREYGYKIAVSPGLNYNNVAIRFCPDKSDSEVDDSRKCYNVYINQLIFGEKPLASENPGLKNSFTKVDSYKLYGEVDLSQYVSGDAISQLNLQFYGKSYNWFVFRKLVEKYYSDNYPDNPITCKEDKYKNALFYINGIYYDCKMHPVTLDNYVEVNGRKFIPEFRMSSGVYVYGPPEQ